MPVEISLGDGQASVQVATADDLQKHFVELRGWISDASTREELLIDLINSKTTPGSALTWTFLDLGGPKVGWLWDVMRLAVNGNDPTATVAGNVFAFVAGRAPYDNATVDPFGPVVEVGTGTIPNIAFYSRQQFLVRPDQHVILGFKGLPSSTQIFGGGQAVQYRDPMAGDPVNPYRRSK